MSTTFITGEIDLAGVPKERRDEIKKTLQSFYGTRATEEIYLEDYLSFDEEWFSHEDTDNFMKLLVKILPFLEKNTVARLSCEGESHQDYWGIIIKKNKMYIQKYKLQPVGDKKEFVYSPVIQQQS